MSIGVVTINLTQNQTTLVQPNFMHGFFHWGHKLLFSELLRKDGVVKLIADKVNVTFHTHGDPQTIGDLKCRLDSVTQGGNGPVAHLTCTQDPNAPQLYAHSNDSFAHAPAQVPVANSHILHTGSAAHTTVSANMHHAASAVNSHVGAALAQVHHATVTIANHVVHTISPKPVVDAIATQDYLSIAVQHSSSLGYEIAAIVAGFATVGALMLNRKKKPPIIIDTVKTKSLIRKMTEEEQLALLKNMDILKLVDAKGDSVAEMLLAFATEKVKMEIVKHRKITNLIRTPGSHKSSK
jgi:hypothetical protein